MKCGHEVPEVILLQTYLYDYSLVRGAITLEVLPLSSFCT
jgi:hypothetical protein